MISAVIFQMKWRLREGQGEAIYEIGVGDDGYLHGLTGHEMNASLDTLETMATRLGASVTVLRQRYNFLNHDENRSILMFVFL